MAERITNVTLVLSDGEMGDGELLFDGGLIKKIGPAGSCSGKETDGGGGFLLPGLIDLHVHGAMGRDFSDPGGWKDILFWHLAGGTTALLPTTISGTPELWRTTAGAARRRYPGLPAILGLHLEGPLINPRQAGIHPAENLGVILWPHFREFIASEPLVRLVTLAPELPGMGGFISWLKERGVVATAGHTEANQEEMAKAITGGISRATHLFNAMGAFHHREPGAAGESLADPRVTVELISDGIHLHPSVLRLVLAAKGYQKINLITDAVPLAGLSYGEKKMFAGKECRMTTEGIRDGQNILAGSGLSMIHAVKNMVHFTGCPLWQAVYMASAVPAKTLGIFRQSGSIEPGKRADLVLLDAGLSVRGVWIEGRRVLTTTGN